MNPLVGTWTDAAGMRMYARVAARPPTPNAPAVVLVHGVGVSSRNMVPIAEALARRCAVYAPDLPGHGLSEKPREVLDVAALADAVAAWLESAEVGRAALVGNSFGCQIVVELARRHPDRVERAVLQGPTTDPAARGWLRQIGRWLLNGLREPSAQQEATFADWRAAGLRRLVLTARATLRDPVEDKLRDVAVPVLVVRGSRDPIVPQPWAEEVTRRLPRGRLAIVDGATHTLTYRYPEQLADVVLPFLFEGRERPEAASA